MKQNSKQSNIDTIMDINFPKDVLFEKGYLHTLDKKPNQKQIIKSGYYINIIDIFNNEKHYTKSEKSTNYKVFFDKNDYHIAIYDVFQNELNDSCDDCLPLFDCYYFDGRYAILTQEDAYKRLILDLKTQLNIEISYNTSSNHNIKEIIYLNNKLEPILSIKVKNKKLKLIKFNINKEVEVQVDSYITNKQTIENLSYKELINIKNKYIQAN